MLIVILIGAVVIIVFYCKAAPLGNRFLDLGRFLLLRGELLYLIAIITTKGKPPQAKNIVIIVIIFIIVIMFTVVIIAILMIFIEIIAVRVVIVIAVLLGSLL